MNKNASLLACTIVAVLGLASAAAAQVSTGERVRVDFEPDHEIEGSWVGASADSVSLSVNGTTVHIERGSIERVHRYDGRHGNWKKGALIGALAGATCTALAYALFSESDDDWDGAGWVFAEFMVLGAVPGALIGSLIKTDTWESVPLDKLTLSTRIDREGGTAVALTVSF
ncbi:MAG TPA: hypothetical protein VFU38_01360 [Candidatus Krumholzibacteria bacterium]|nr:hypothetical protein [Candidatus Krumholzibacteria bacterium]